MEKAIVEGNIGKFVERRSSGLKIAVRLLHHELELAQGKEVVLDRALLENLTTSVELFLEDFGEQYARHVSGAVVADRKLVEPAKPAQSRAN